MAYFGQCIYAKPFEQSVRSKRGQMVGLSVYDYEQPRKKYNLNCSVNGMDVALVVKCFLDSERRVNVRLFFSECRLKTPYENRQLLRT